jgi:4-hydroxy-tetrahydrodipicolinate synthase
LSQRPVVITATPTPFLEDGSLDLPSARRLFEALAATRIDAWFVAGTTGEFPALDDDERVALFRLAVEIGGPIRVIAHVGAASARQAAALVRRSMAVGVRRFAAVTPYYLPATAAEVDASLETITTACDGHPLYLYLIPRLTGTQLNPTEAAAAVHRFSLAGLKLSMPGTAYLAAVKDLVPSSTELLSGEDRLLKEVVETGGRGVVSGVSSACPSVFTEWADAMIGSDDHRQESARRRAELAVAAIAPRISHAKVALQSQGLFASPTCRMAIAQPNPSERQAILAAMGQPGRAAVANP